jgi:hypothetical protein
MLTHVKTLGILNIVLSSLGILAAVLALLFFGGIAGIVGMACQDEGRLIAVPILGLVGSLIFILVMLGSIPGVIAGADC